MNKGQLQKMNCTPKAGHPQLIKVQFFYEDRVVLFRVRGNEHYYNHERIKLKLKGLSPVEYRTQPSLAA